MGPILKHPSVEEYLTGRKYQDIELCLGKGLKTWPLVTDCSDIFHRKYHNQNIIEILPKG